MTISVTTSGPISTAVDTNPSVLEVANDLALDLGLPSVTILVGSTDQTTKEIEQFLVESCEELSRRVDWGGLTNKQDFTGVGTATEFTVPLDFSRLIRGTAAYSNNLPVRGGLSDDEWFGITPTEGQPRYFHLRGNTVAFYPYLAAGQTATIHYQSKGFTIDGLDEFTKDDDALAIPHQLVRKGFHWRWRRHKGQDYSDHMAEYEAALSDYAEFDVRDRTP